jgi:Peptidase U49
MPSVERVNIEPIKKLLRMAAPAKAAELDDLFQRLSPVCELNRNEERILFQADAEQKLIRIGTKCTIRLQAHALAAGVVIAGISTPGFKEMDSGERKKLFSPADVLFTWAVGRDLQQLLKRLEGYDRDLNTILQGAENDFPKELLSWLSKGQRGLGEGLFRFATAYIVLHELGHLNFGHRGCQGYWSVQQEKDADSFAADWLLEAATQKETQASRLNALFGISVALLWLTVFNVFLGRRQSSTHPEGYDRLFQVLDRGIDPNDEIEHQMVWFFISTMLLCHMWAAGFDFDNRDAAQMQGDPRDEVNYLINRIANEDRKR